MLTGVGLGGGIDVNEDSGVGRAVDTRNLDSRGRSSSGSSNVDLEAGHVESIEHILGHGFRKRKGGHSLSTTNAAGNMKSY